MGSLGVSEGTPAVAIVAVAGETYQVVVPEVQDDHVQHHLFNSGRPYDAEKLAAVSALLTSDSIVLDVGSQVGNHTLYWACVVGSSVIAYESNDVSAAALEQSIERNDVLDRVRLRHGELQSLDHENFDDPVALVRIDRGLDGAEVLRGARTLIDRDRPLLWVESSSPEAYEEVVTWMRENNYGHRATSEGSDSLYAPQDEHSVELREARDEAASYSRKANSAQMAFERVRGEALQYRNERDARTEQISRLREQLRLSRSDLKTERAQTAKLAKQSKLLYAHPALRLSRLIKRIMRRPALLVRKFAPAPKVTTGPAPKKVAAPVEARTIPLDDCRLLDREVRVAREEQAQRSAKALTEVIASGQPLRVAAVVDEFTRQALSEECLLLNLNSNTWREQLEEFAPNLLFVESAWRGDQGSWHNTVPRFDEHLSGIVEYCRERSIPTVFWNKEDPVHFETFLRVASEFDQVFTTDIDRVGQYMSRIGHSRVGMLAFAAQPTIHNPIETFERREALVFAGGYYQRYTERMADLRALVDGISVSLPIEIFDRNLGTTLEAYAFPEEYQKYIVGTLAPKDIDVAYKGYRYALNLNSVKSSQSMFARRAFELLASNTMTISNYARGIKVLLGNLIPMSDSEDMIRDTVAGLVADPDRTDKIRAMGVRKVLGEHTYAHRLATVVESLTGLRPKQPVPEVTVVSETSSVEAAMAVQERVASQLNVIATLVLVTADQATQEWAKTHGVVTYSAADLTDRALADVLSPGADGVAVFSPDDWYGAHYLADLTSAWKYSTADIIGKHQRYETRNRVVQRVDGVEYRATAGLELRSSVVRASAAQLIPASSYADGQALPKQLAGLAIHRFDYCQNAVADGVDVSGSLSAWLPIDTGVPIAEIERRVLAWELDESTNDTPVVHTDSLPTKPHANTRKRVNITVSGHGVVIKSSIKPDTVRRIWSTHQIDVHKFWPDGIARLSFIAHGDLELRAMLKFLDADGDVLGVASREPNGSREVRIPDGTVSARLGWRVEGPGRARVSDVALAPSHDIAPPQFGSEDNLLVSDHYPAYDDLYRNGFVHARVRRYRDAGMSVEVFKHKAGVNVTHREFEGVDVTTGSAEVLHDLVESRERNSIVVHFLSAQIWDALRAASSNTRILIWLHGAEVQSWWRREFNYETEEERAEAEAMSAAKTEFWRSVIDTAGSNVHFIFVSQHLADEVQEDLERPLDPSRYSVLHNPIDTDIFAYRPKVAEQRHKILSLRPYATRVYANDLSVAAVLELSTQPWFDQLSFRFIGDGPLFEETLAPLVDMPNVTIERGYLNHRQIAELYEEYGVVLIPSRSETHGVSRDEAMASGMVPVASAVAAVPEFLSEEEGFLAPFGDHHALAAAIVEMHEDPEGFLRRSAAAAARVRRQAGADVVIPEEIRLIQADE